MVDFLVVGAGLAGLSFAQEVQAQGASVILLDKGRGVGGRCATRRWHDTRVDHGAQYFTARSERLQTWVAEALSDGWLTVWTYGFPLWQEGTLHQRPAGHPRYAPVNGMNELGKRLGEGLTIKTSVTVTALSRNNDGIYQATGENGEIVTGRNLVLNLPPAQLLHLATDLLSPEMRSEIGSVVFLPAWALLLRLEVDISGAENPETGWKAIEFADHPVLGWVSRDHTKRKESTAPVLVVHGSGEWSKAHLVDSPEDVQASLLEATQEVLGSLAVVEAQVHRWRYALPTQVIPAKHLWDTEQRIGACGDWCGGPRVEGAMESGWSLAEATLST
jgi:hypothetical protein